MQIAARRRHVGVTERCLHLGKRGAAIERVAAVGMAQPVRRYGVRDAGPLRRSLDHVADSALLQSRAGPRGGGDRVVGAGVGRGENAGRSPRLDLR